MAGQTFVDRAGNSDFFDDTPVTPIKLRVDENGDFLGVGGGPTFTFPLILTMLLRIHAVFLFLVIPL